MGYLHLGGEDTTENFTAYLTILFSSLKKWGSDLGVNVIFSVLPYLYCPANNVPFEVIDVVNKQIQEFNLLSGCTTFEINNYTLRRVLEGKFGNVHIDGKPFFSPTNCWTTRYSNHLAKSTLKIVLVDLRRYLKSSFARTCPSVATTCAMKYVLDSCERNKLSAGKCSTSVVNSNCIKTQFFDKATQTERFPVKRDFKQSDEVQTKLHDAREAAKRKRDNLLQEAFSVLQTQQSNVNAYAKIVSSSREIEDDLSKCQISN